MSQITRPVAAIKSIRFALLSKTYMSQYVRDFGNTIDISIEAFTSFENQYFFWTIKTVPLSADDYQEKVDPNLPIIIERAMI